ncbi:MAG: hypothetical protein JWN48_5155 [Myxococcaceae bacterium]|nr:hypothetical protein [Myxococcaceae bacterium]
MSALERQVAPDSQTRPLYVALSPLAERRLYRPCRNAVEYAACNWMVPATEPHAYCNGCRMTSVMPDLDRAEALVRWHKLERAKRRLLYTLDQLGLPIESRAERPKNGLAFVFLEHGDLGPEMIFTGHANGMVTINIHEADDPYREQMRKEMGEAYRTLLGHFRHEVGHYYWDRLVRDTPWHMPFRALFGDERLDYAAAARRHYESGAKPGWERSYVSAYATMHPWEDWAETWSHYLHMVDTLDTAKAYSLALRPMPQGGKPGRSVRVRTLHLQDFASVISGWVALTLALNSLNRSMGLADPYPFVLSERAVMKLRFVHDVMEHWRSEELDDVLAQWPSWSETAKPARKEQTAVAGGDVPTDQRDTLLDAVRDTLPELNPRQT